MPKPLITAMDLLEEALDFMERADESIRTALTDHRADVSEGLLGFHAALRAMCERLVRLMENTEL